MTHASKQAFVAGWLTDLLRRDGFTLARANLQKFLIRNLVESRIRKLRKQAGGKAYQQAPFGDFDSKEEFECACQLDMWAQQGRIQFWGRNLVRREGSSFFLQKADGRFYPDFLCQLPGAEGQPGPVLTVEYRGADRWNRAEDDRLIGGLWANLPEGRCRFVMVKDKRWDRIESLLT